MRRNADASARGPDGSAHAMAEAVERGVGWTAYQGPAAPPRHVGGLEAARTPLGAATRVPRPAAPGKLARLESADERHGTAPLCLGFAPGAGPRPGTVTARRPA